MKYRVHVLDLDTGVEFYYPSFIGEGIPMESKEVAQSVATAIEGDMGYLATVEEVELDPKAGEFYE